MEWSFATSATILSVSDRIICSWARKQITLKPSLERLTFKRYASGMQQVASRNRGWQTSSVSNKRTCLVSFAVNPGHLYDLRGGLHIVFSTVEGSQAHDMQARFGVGRNHRQYVGIRRDSAVCNIRIGDADETLRYSSYRINMMSKVAAPNRH